jgi:hypothetical protein
MTTTLTFTSTIDSISVNVSILNDSLTEGNEDFLGRLTILSTGKAVEFFPENDDNAIATILDVNSKLTERRGIMEGGVRFRVDGRRDGRSGE